MRVSRTWISSGLERLRRARRSILCTRETAENLNAFDSIAYAIDEKIAPIISVSYGACETALGAF